MASSTGSCPLPAGRPVGAGVFVTAGCNTGAMTNTPSTPRPPPDTPPHRLALLGCLLPITAVALFLLVLFAWPGTSKDKASDLRTVLFFVSLALVPVAA